MAHSMSHLASSESAPAASASQDAIAHQSPVPDGGAFEDQPQRDVPIAMDSDDEEDRAPTAIDIAIPDHGNPEEERTHTRVHIEVDVTARSDDTFWVGVTENISEGGLFVATSCPWPEDTLCELSLALDDGRPPVNVEGKISWIREDRGNGLTPGMGMSFVGLDPDLRARIQNYVTEHISRTVLWE